MLLQQAGETVTGRAFDEVMRDLVFTPLDMAHSTYRWTPKVAERLLTGTKGNGAPRVTVALQQPVSAFTLYTTAQDSGRFLAAQLRDPAMLQRIVGLAVDVDPRLNLRWRLGWGIE